MHKYIFGKETSNSNNNNKKYLKVKLHDEKYEAKKKTTLCQSNK